MGLHQIPTCAQYLAQDQTHEKHTIHSVFLEKAHENGTQLLTYRSQRRQRTVCKILQETKVKIKIKDAKFFLISKEKWKTILKRKGSIHPRGGHFKTYRKLTRCKYSRWNWINYFYKIGKNTFCYFWQLKGLNEHQELKTDQ